MDWQDTLYRWEEYSEKLYPLRDEVRISLRQNISMMTTWNIKSDCMRQMMIPCPF